VDAGAVLQVGAGGTSGRLGDGTGAVVNDGQLVINRSDSYLLGNVISGAGALYQSGSGVTVLMGNNSYSGGTWINAGVLQVGNGGASGWMGSGAVVDNSSLVFNRSDNITVANVISGTGSLTQMGGGILTLVGANSYSGGTVITNGSTIYITNGSALGSGDVQMFDGTTLGFVANLTLANNVILHGDPTFYVSNGLTAVDSGLISGDGDLVKAGGGTLTLAGNNTYTGPTIINAGVLQVGNGGTSGTLGSGDVTNSSSLIFNRSDTMVVGNLITGSGSLTQNGSGTTVLTGNNDYTGGTWINAGVLQVGNGGTSGWLGSGPIVDNSSLVFNRSDDITVSNSISGSGSLTQAGTGRLTLAGDNSGFTGAILIGPGGTLEIAGANTLGNGPTIEDNGVLVFNVSVPLTVNQWIYGAGGVIQQGSGPVTFTFGNTYSGGTIITNGATLYVAHDNALGTGLLTMYEGTKLGFLGSYTLGNDVLLVGDPYFYVTNNAIATESGNISGAGDLVKLGAGTLVLTGSNDYSGATVISNGVLMIGNGLITGTLGTGVVSNGATLALNPYSGVPLWVPNVISGSGTLHAMGGLSVLTGDNDYSGLTKVDAGAVLQVGAGGTSGRLGDGTGAVVNDGQLVINRSDSYLLGNVISGAGALYQSGSGVTVLTGNNSYSGGTWITNGTLVVGHDNALGIGIVTVNGATVGSQGDHTVGNIFKLDGASTFDTSGGNLTLGGVILGVGTLINAGTGSLTLNGANSYSGGTSNKGGWLVVGHNTALGTGILYMNGGTLSSGGGTLTVTLANAVHLLAAANRVDTSGGNLTLTGPITGAGGNDLWKLGPNVLTLTGSNVYRDTYVIAGTLAINNAGVTSNQNGYVGWFTNNTAAAVTGRGSSWKIEEMLLVGLYGNYNSLAITNAGNVNDRDGYIGYGGNYNSGLVSGSNSVWNNARHLTVGRDGSFNTLTVNNMGQLYSQRGIIGHGVLGDAVANSVLIAGNGTRWINSEDLYIGLGEGSGAAYNILTIADGALVSNVNAFVGYNGYGNTGLVNHATWHNTGDLVVGFNSSDNALVVTNAALVRSVNGFVGFTGWEWADGNSALITGAGSRWLNSGDLFVGWGDARGNGLTIANGGLVSNVNGYVGFESGWYNSATVDGAGSKWINTGDLYIGTTDAEFNSLAVLAGGYVENQRGYVGAWGNRNSALVSGAGSVWNNFSDLEIGRCGAFNSLTIAGGGVVSNLNGYVGAIDADGNSALVTGAGSRWVNRGDLFVGYDPSSNNSLVISNGGVVTATNTWLGYSAGSTNNSVTVTDPGSLLLDYGDLTVGVTGSYNWVSILSGGTASNVNGYIGRTAGASNNWVLVNNGAWINSSNVVIGLYGAFNSLTVTNNGLVRSVNGFVGSGGNNNRALVAGTGALWANAANLMVGGGGSYNQLTVLNGGTVSNVDAWVGYYGNSNTGLVNNGTWINTAALIIGQGSQYNALVVTNAGLVRSAYGMVGNYGTNNSALVTGAGSRWLNDGALYVGYYGSFNALTVANGGLVSNLNGYVGAIDANGNSALVTGAGSRWVNRGDLFVGYDPSSNNSLVISNGGVVIATNTWLGYSAGSTNNSVTVTGTGSLLLDYGDLTVGVTGSYNWVSILSGGTASNVNGYVGRLAGANYNRALVNNGTWINTGNLSIGQTGQFNSLTITNAGVVRSVAGIVGLGGNNNSALVTGTGSLWDNSANLFVGTSAGSYNLLSILNGGLVSNQFGFVGNYANANTAVVNNATWINNADLYIGNIGNQNALIVTNGGRVRDVRGYVGYQGTNNSALVSGTGSLWDNAGDLFIGLNGAYNWLTINNGGLVSNQFGFVGYYANANTAVVNNATWINNAYLYIGNAGNQNALIVTNGGRVRDVRGYVGNQGTNNSALVSGTGSLWDNAGDLFIGLNGGAYNWLTINNGGIVSNANGWVGEYANANTAVVNNATWINNGNLYVGHVGDNNALIVTNAGIVKSVDGFVGLIGTNNSALVTGLNSLWNNSGNLLVGDIGSNNRLTISNRGVVSNQNGYVGYGAGSMFNTALVDNATWINNVDLTIGFSADYNALVVQNTGVVRSVNGYVGQFRDNNTALVTGPGSLWNNTGNLFIGLNGGSSNSLTISAGGRVSDVGGIVGANADNNRALVTGSGSAWNNSGDLFIGSNSAYNVLTISSGGVVSNVSGYVGYTGNNNSALITDNGSVWNNSSSLFIGRSGHFNTMTITNGGRVNSTYGYAGWAGNSNAVLVTGTGSVWFNTSNLEVGEYGNYNTMTVRNGGAVSNAQGRIGYYGIANGVLVTDAGSVWRNSGDLHIGQWGFYNTMTVSNGGVVRAANATIGLDGNNNLAVVTGNNSLWENSGLLFVGVDNGSGRGNFNSLVVTNGGVVRNADAYVGVSGTSNSVLVSGVGSLWNNNGNLYIGSNGTYNVLTINSLGTVSNASGYVGYMGGTSYNNATVDNATWVNTGSLSVGYSDDHNTLTVTNNGKVYSVNGYIGVNSQGHDNSVLVTGTGSLWNMTGDLFVGLNGGSNNVLSIRNGGRVNGRNGYVGNNANYNWVYVSDPGSLWNMTGDLFVGLNGGSYNSLYIWGGTVSASNAIIGASPSVGNYIGVDGGSLVVTNPAGGLVDVRNGSLWFDEGNILLNHLFVEPNGWYSDTGDGLMTLVNPNPIIEIAGGKIITINSTIAGSQGMSKAGAGELILTAANTYTGPTFVNDGTLTVRNSNGVGSGNMNVMNGTLRTGSENTGVPLGLNITGSYTQAVNGRVELGVGGTVFPSNDWLNVGGNASLNGTLRVFKLATFVPLPFDKAILLRAAGGVTGTFSTFLDDIPASPMLDSALLYHPNDVTLTWNQLPFTPWAVTPNQLAVAGALDSALTNEVMKELFARLDYPNYPDIPTPSVLSNTLPRDFDLIAPDELTALFSLPFGAMDIRGYSFLARMQELRAGSHGFNANRLALYNTSGLGNSPQPINHGYAAVTQPCADICAPTKDNPWGLYLEGVGEFIDVDSDANATGYHLRSAGFTLGLDRRLGQEWAVGLTLGYGYDHAGLVNDGSVNVDAARASLYATWFKQGWHIEAMALGGLNWYKTKRLAIDGFAHGETEGKEYGGLIGGGYDWQKGICFFGPQVVLQYKRVDIDGFQEEGSLSPLDVLSQSEDSLFTRVGAHFGCRAKVGKSKSIIVAPDLSLAWQHEFLHDSLALDSRFANGAGNIFTVHGPEVGRDSLVIGAGIWVQWSPTVGTYLNYTTQLLRDGYEPHNVNAGFCFRF